MVVWLYVGLLFVCVFVCSFVCLLVGWLVGCWVVGLLVCWLVCWFVGLLEFEGDDKLDPAGQQLKALLLPRCIQAEVTLSSLPS